MSTTVVLNDKNVRPAKTPRRTIDLDVAGGDLMLRGRFSQWESGMGLGPDLDRVGLRLAIDATSSAAAAGVPGGGLFSFRSRTVVSDGPGAYRATGVFTGPTGSKPLEVTVETPLDHTALFMLSFAADRQDFGDGWADLLENVVPFAHPGDGEPVRSAHAWLTAPVLAAA